MLVMDLLQSFLGTTIQFKLHDVDILLGFQHEIHASLGSVVLDFRVETDQFEDDEKHVLIMPFLLADQFVRSIGQEAFQSIKKGLQLSCTYFTDEFQMELQFC